MINDYRDLDVWKLGIEIVIECYAITRKFPKEELFGLTAQIRRAATPIPANIAEGHGRQHTKEFLNHLSIANGSLKELETHLLIASRLDYLSGESYQHLLELTKRSGQMLARLRQSLQRRL